MSSPAFQVEEGVRLLRLSLSSYAWVGRPVIEPFPRLKELGIHQLQIFMWPGHFTGESEEEIAALEQAAQANGVAFPSLHAPFLDLDLASSETETYERTMEALEATLALARRLAARRVVVHPRGADRQGEPEDQLGFELLGQRLETLKRAARRHGVSVCLENLPGSDFGALPNRLLALDHGQFCLDLGHAHLNGHLAPGLIRRFESRLSVLHVNDNQGSRDEHLPPGRGGIDWEGIERELLEIRFHGEYCIEIAEGGDLEDKLGFFSELVRRNRFYLTE